MFEGVEHLEEKLRSQSVALTTLEESAASKESEGVEKGPKPSLSQSRSTDQSNSTLTPHYIILQV